GSPHECERQGLRSGREESGLQRKGAGGRVHVYQGAGQAPSLSDGGAGSCSEDAGACLLWSTKPALERYDGVLLGCECGEHNETKPDKTPMHDWLDEGGRVLAVHYGSTSGRPGSATGPPIFSPSPPGACPPTQALRARSRWIHARPAATRSGTGSRTCPRRQARASLSPGERERERKRRGSLDRWLDLFGYHAARSTQHVVLCYAGSGRCRRRPRALLRKSRLLRRSRRRPTTEFHARAVGLCCRADEPRRRDTGIRYLLVVVYVRQRGSDCAQPGR